MPDITFTMRMEKATVDLLRRAARLRGQSLNSFVVEAVHAEALEILRRSEMSVTGDRPGK